jgi:hypothetical protein
MNQPTLLRPRILLVEDDAERIATYRAWVSESVFVLIEASSGGRAKGILRPGMTRGIAGICLDHDLEKQPVTQTDLCLSASDLIGSIVASVARNVPVLIHSMNAQKPPAMQRALESARFAVTRIRYTALSRNGFHEWLDNVRAEWEYHCDDK